MGLLSCLEHSVDLRHQSKVLKLLKTLTIHEQVGVLRATAARSASEWLRGGCIRDLKSFAVELERYRFELIVHKSFVLC